MSDEHEHHHEDAPQGYVPFVLSMGPTPEQVEQAKLSAMANSHDMRDYLNNLDERGLLKTIAIVQMVSDNEAAAMYYIGIMAQMMDTKFGKCLTCGNDHDNPFPEEMGRADDSSATPDAELMTQYRHDLDLYGMEEWGTDKGGANGNVRCIGCGTVSISLADRMLRPPGVKGCEGCKQKAAWG